MASDDFLWSRGAFADIEGKIKFTEDFYHKVSLEKLNLVHFDMAVARECNHSIFDYGTFGFWGAFLKDEGAITIQAHKVNRKLILILLKH